MFKKANRSAIHLSLQLSQSRSETFLQKKWCKSAGGNTKNENGITQNPTKGTPHIGKSSAKAPEKSHFAAHSENFTCRRNKGRPSLKNAQLHFSIKRTRCTEFIARISWWRTVWEFFRHNRSKNFECTAKYQGSAQLKCGNNFPLLTWGTGPCSVCCRKAGWIPT